MQKINYFDDLTIYTVAKKALLVPFRYSINLVDNWYSLNFIRSGCGWPRKLDRLHWCKTGRKLEGPSFTRKG